VQVLEEIGIPYLVTGSTATIAYGEPRFTNDIDVVVDLHLDQVPALCAAFADPEYYLSRSAAMTMIRCCRTCVRLSTGRLRWTLRSRSFSAAAWV
jgi:hypothetical protein